MEIDEVVIRDFKPEDQQAARSLILRGLVERWGDLDETLNSDLDDIACTYAGAVFLVAVQDGQLIATGALIPEGDGVGRIVRMSVSRSHRRRRLGRQLLQVLLERAHALGYHRLVLETTGTWADAIAFYQAHGFRPVAARDGDLHFVLDLSEARVGTTEHK